jgi:hypothetical protein
MRMNPTKKNRTEKAKEEMSAMKGQQEIVLRKALLETPFDREDLLAKLETIQQTGYKITLWQELYDLATLEMEKKNTKCDLLLKANLLDFSSIEEDIQHITAGGNETYKQYEEEKRDGRIPKRILYRLWEHMFVGRGNARSVNDELLLESLSKNERNKRERMVNIKKKYLTSLTEHILVLYRDQIVINDAFVHKCFEHNLDKILTTLLETQRFYRIELSQGTLLDLYIVLACDVNNMKMLIKLLPDMNIHHLEYALKYGSYDLLSIIYRYRKTVPSFDANMRMLDRIFTKKDWKLIKFFDRWRREMII